MVDDKVFMKEALKQAEKAYEKNEIPIGAVLVKDGKIISRGRNSVIKKNDMTSHAEINALRKAGKKNWKTIAFLVLHSIQLLSHAQCVQVQ